MAGVQELFYIVSPDAAFAFIRQRFREFFGFSHMKKHAFLLFLFDAEFGLSFAIKLPGICRRE